MYKFSRCHAVIFHSFFRSIYWFLAKNRPVSNKIRAEIITPIFEKKHRFISEIGWLIVKTGRISVFYRYSRCPVRFRPNFLKFHNFFWIFKNWRISTYAEFSNTAQDHGQAPVFIWPTGDAGRHPPPHPFLPSPSDERHPHLSLEKPRAGHLRRFC
jgi:hypothetical protein